MNPTFPDHLMFVAFAVTVAGIAVTCLAMAITEWVGLRRFVPPPIVPRAPQRWTDGPVQSVLYDWAREEGL